MLKPLVSEQRLLFDRETILISGQLSFRTLYPIRREIAYENFACNFKGFYLIEVHQNSTLSASSEGCGSRVIGSRCNLHATGSERVEIA